MNERTLFFVYLLIVSILSVADAKPSAESRNPSVKSTLSNYERLAKRCYIDDYAAWLQRESELLEWLQIAQILELPIHDGSLMQQEFKQHRLQRECLRIHERLPLSIGPG